MARGRARVVGAALLVALLLAPAAVSGQTLDDLDAAERRADELDAELESATEAYEEAWARLESVRDELQAMRRRAVELEQEAADAERRLAERARQVFMQGSTSAFETVLAAPDAQMAVERAGMIAALQLRETATLETAVATRVALDQHRLLVEDRQAQLVALADERDDHAAQLQELLEAAQERFETIRDQTARQRRISRGPQQGIYACIFDQGAFRFRDTWGAPRSGGRRHRGTDVFAAYRAPVYAIASGVVQRRSHSGLGGLGLYLRGDDGNVYYYAHLDSTEPAGSVGNRVVAGQLIARNGSTGNASRSAPHVHFEVHPGGGSAINPYPWLAAACY